MKIGILTYHRANNYGAFLQAYGLTMKLREIGYDAEIIDYNMKCAEEQYSVKNKNLINRYYENIRHKMFTREQKRLPLSNTQLISDNIDDFRDFVKGKYDAIIAGSDEIWKLDSFRGFPNPYWLIGDLGSKKMSYAASSRSSFSSLSKDNLELIKKTLKEFRIIGVRDQYTYDELKKITDIEINLCCDPVFLYAYKVNADRGKEILYKRFKIKKDKHILGVMINDSKLAKKIQKKLGKDFQLISLFRQWKGYHKTADLTPFEWYDVIAALDIFVTNYFHGVCFSFIGNTNFIAIDSREKEIKNSKIYDLLQRNNSLDRFLTTSDNEYMDKVIKLCKEMPKKDFSDIVLNERRLGEKYLKRLEEELNQNE